MAPLISLAASALINETKSARKTDSENLYFPWWEGGDDKTVVWAEIKAKDGTIKTRFNRLTFDRVESLPALNEKPDAAIYKDIIVVHTELVDLIPRFLSVIATGNNRTKQLCMSMYYLFRIVDWFAEKGETDPGTILESIKNSPEVSGDKAIEGIVKDTSRINAFITGCLKLFNNRDIKVCIEGIGGYTDWRDDDVYSVLEDVQENTDTFPDNVYVIVFPGITVNEHVIAKAVVVHNTGF